MVVWGYTRITPFVLLPTGALTLIGLVYGLSEFDAKRRGIDPKSAGQPSEVTPADD
jgi:hypothetical protein